MRKIIQLVKDWLERRKDSQGEYLVVYFDRDNEVRHRLQFASKTRAERAYKVLEQEVNRSANSHMIVQMFKDNVVIKTCDSDWAETRLRPIEFMKEG